MVENQTHHIPFAFGSNPFLCVTIVGWIHRREVQLVGGNLVNVKKLTLVYDCRLDSY